MPKDNKNSTRKELSSKQREELFATLKARFEKNMNRHLDLEWANVRARLEANAEKLWSLNEMEAAGGEPDVVGTIKRPANTFSMIVRRKVPRAAPVFATTVKLWIPGKNTNRKAAPWIWQRPWALAFQQKNNTKSCRSLEISTRSRRVG